MNSTRRITGENELLELTDVDLESVGGGWSIFQSFNTGANVQMNSYVDGSFGNFGNSTFGSLASNQGGFQIGGARSSNYYNYSVNLFSGK